MIKCLIFDCDGTLVDSEYLCNLALEQKLAEYKVNIKAEELVSRFRGGNLSNMLSILEKENSVTFKVNFTEEYRSLVAKLFASDLKACEGVEDALKELQFPMCVASSGPPEKIKNALSLTNLSKYFGDNIFSSYVVKSWKPEPELFLHSAKKMGYSPINCVVIEDSDLGIQAAKSAGMNPILYDPNQIYDDIKDVSKIRNMSKLKNAIMQFK